jgi:peptidyl-prolyl cis-trans isomerase C
MNTQVINLQTITPQALPVISVNGVRIDENDLANELQYHRHSQFSSVLQQAGQALVIRQLLLQQASKSGFAVGAENEEAVIQQLLENAVVCAEPNEDDCRRYFDNNPDKFKVMPLMEIEHILLAAPKDDPSARTDALIKAKDILAQLQTNPGLFAALAE